MWRGVGNVGVSVHRWRGVGNVGVYISGEV